jgi:hypothetical protein
MDATEKSVLGAELHRIRSEHPGALQQSPLPGRIESQPTPMVIHFAAWAAAVAQGLHERFGSDVDLAVGLLRFPSREPLQPGVAPEVSPVAAEGIEVSADHALQVRSGYRLDAAVTVRNHSDSPLHLIHHGGDHSLYGIIVDSDTGEVANGHMGWAPLIDTKSYIPADGDLSITLRAYTDSRVARFGYALPPGTWQLRARLNTTDGRHLYSEALPLTITESQITSADAGTGVSTDRHRGDTC